MNVPLLAEAARVAEDAGSELDWLPIVVLGVYLCLLIGLGAYGYIKSKMTEEDYYLAGRQQGFIVTSLTIMATFFSSAAMLAVPGQMYKEGVVFCVFALNLPIGGIAVYLMGSRIARLGRAKGYVTPGDMVADYYDNSSAVRLLVALLGFLYVVPYVIQIRAGGHLAQQLFPNAQAISLFGQQLDVFAMGSSVLSGVMLIYILVGGMRSVAMADVVQGSLLLVGMLVGGYAAISALGGIDGYCKRVSELPPEALSFPGATGRYTVWSLMTICIFAPLASMIQPAQWMRFYAARSTQTLKLHSALIFCMVLPICYLFGVMLVGFGARALYPPAMVDGVLQPHGDVHAWDQALIAVLRNEGLQVLGSAGGVIVAVIMMAILAASMSTADSNLHALGAVVTRDVYDRFLRPQASQLERAWVGRIVIIAAALLALVLVQVGQHNKEWAPLKMIVEMQFVAMAFACQMLPVTIDMLFIRRGTRVGAIGGMLVGLIVVLFFTPAPGLLLDESDTKTVADTAAYLKSLFDIGFCGMVVNVAVFVVLGAVTRRPDPERVAEVARIMRGEND